MSVIIEKLTNLIAAKNNEIEEWFLHSFAKSGSFFYSSVDIRHSGFKIAPVDTNLFPGGFNNLSTKEIEQAIKSTRAFFHATYPNQSKILLIVEDHTRNLYYLENVAVLEKILSDAGMEVRISSFGAAESKNSLQLTSLSGVELNLDVFSKKDGLVKMADGFVPDVVIVNNDLTGGAPEIISDISQPVLPPIGYGWYQRRKTSHFDAYDGIARSFCRHFNIDPWLITTIFHKCGVINFKEKKGIECVALGVNKVVYKTRKKYEEYGITEEPYVFIKSNRGTYGMGIMTARSGDEVIDINKKLRNKMSSIKGGVDNTEVIIQEGIPTIDKIDGYPAEPLVYVVGGEPIGCFYRVNNRKDAYGNLNASGMQFVSSNKEHGGLCQATALIARLAGYASALECYSDNYEI